MHTVLHLVAMWMVLFSPVRTCSNANWWSSFDREGESMCNGVDLIRGFYRNNRQSPDNIYNLEEAVCCRRQYPFTSVRVVTYANWWSTLDSSNRWATCPPGFFLHGLWRTNGRNIHNIEEGRCLKPADHPYNHGHCYDEDISTSFDAKGTSKCRDNYYVTGFYRGSCDDLLCIEKLKCCKMASQPDTLDSLNKVKTMVMDKTLYRMSLLAHYLGYGWCAGCRAAYVGEDFKRSGDTFSADKTKRCDGYKSGHRLSINFADWSFSIVSTSYGRPQFTELTPETIDTGVIDNHSSTKSMRTITRSEESVRTVTHTTTSSWKSSHELGIEITYSPPEATGGVGGSISYTFGYESGATTTDSTDNTQKNTLSVADSKEFPPYSSTNYTLIVSKTRTTMAYTSVVIAHFSAQLRGFLRWGGGSGSTTTNYHHQHRGSGDRPTVDYRFGDANTPFYQALHEESSTLQLPWLWADMIGNYGSAQYIIDRLKDESNYEFRLTGKFDDVVGKKIDIIWQEIPYRGSRRAVVDVTDDNTESLIDLGTHTSVATEMPGDPAAVFPDPPVVDLNQGEPEEEETLAPIGIMTEAEG